MSNLNTVLWSFSFPYPTLGGIGSPNSSEPGISILSCHTDNLGLRHRWRLSLLRGTANLSVTVGNKSPIPLPLIPITIKLVAVVFYNGTWICTITPFRPASYYESRFFVFRQASPVQPENSILIVTLTNWASLSIRVIFVRPVQCRPNGVVLVPPDLRTYVTGTGPSNHNHSFQSQNWDRGVCFLSLLSFY